MKSFKTYFFEKLIRPGVYEVPEPDEEHRRQLQRTAREALVRSRKLKPAAQKKYVHYKVFAQAHEHATAVENHKGAAAHFVAKHRADAAISRVTGSKPTSRSSFHT